jgi:capsular polysaccharide biosynthesis protein
VASRTAETGSRIETDPAGEWDWGSAVADRSAPSDVVRLIPVAERWPLILVVGVLFAAVAAPVSWALPSVYSSTALILVGKSTGGQVTFEQVQADEAYARTYARLMDSRALAARVGSKLSFSSTPAEARAAMSFVAINDTPLIEVTAEADNPKRAQELANGWARTFVSDGPAVLGVRADPATLSDPAQIPTGTVRPRPLLYTAVAAIVGLAVGAAIASFAPYQWIRLLRGRGSRRTARREGHRAVGRER